MLDKSLQKVSPSREDWIKAIRIQARVTYALMLREIKTLYGKSRLGYLMHMIQQVIQILFFWGIRHFLRAHAPGDIPLPIYLLSGFTVWLIFSNILTKSMAAHQANRALLYFSRVQMVDALLARAILIYATTMVNFVIFLVVLYLFGVDFSIDSLSPMLYSTLFAAMLGLGFGVLFSSVQKYIPSINVAVSVVTRIMFFTSGIIIDTQSFPAKALQYLQYNPLMTLVDHSRLAFLSSYYMPVALYNYVAFLTLCALCVGFFSERVTRHKVD